MWDWIFIYYDMILIWSIEIFMSAIKKCHYYLLWVIG